MRWWSNGVLYVSAAISIIIAVAGVATKVAKLAVTQDMLRDSLRHTLRSQDNRISKLEAAQMKEKTKPKPEPKIPE